MIKMCVMYVWNYENKTHHFTQWLCIKQAPPTASVTSSKPGQAHDISCVFDTNHLFAILI